MVDVVSVVHQSIGSILQTNPNPIYPNIISRRRGHEMRCGTQIGQGRTLNGRRFTEKLRTKRKERLGGVGEGGVGSGSGVLEDGGW